MSFSNFLPQIVADSTLGRDACHRKSIIKKLCIEIAAETPCMKTVGWNPPEHSKTLFHISKTGHPPHSSPCILHRLVYAVNLNRNCVGDLGALAMADLLASMSAGKYVCRLWLQQPGKEFVLSHVYCLHVVSK